MAVQAQCSNPDCRAAYDVPDADLGRSGRCRRCGSKFAPLTTRIAAPVPDNASRAVKGVAPRSGPPELAAGESFGRYRILRRLGSGGMAIVYLAYDTQLDREVAMKIPRFEADESPEIVQRFAREARALARLNHPSICPVLDVGQVGGVLFLTMPYIQGQPLATLIADQAPPRWAAVVVRRLARALAEAHARGIIHRDLKPSNVLINSQREVVLIDFGLARRVDAGDPSLTLEGALLGTPAYMAPEQIEGDVAAIGPGCDIYSLGVILYELLTGRLPFVGRAAEVLNLAMTSEPPPVSALRPDLDWRLDAICRQAMARKIEDRFASMTALAEELEAYLRDSLPAAEPPRRRSPSRRRRLAAGLAALGLLGAIAWVATDTGTVRIDVPDPDVVVRIDSRPIRIEELDRPVSLRAGEHQLIVTRDHQVIESRTFEVRRHEQTALVVRPSPIPGPSAPEEELPPAPPPSAPESALPVVAKGERESAPEPPGPEPAPPAPVVVTHDESGPSPDPPVAETPAAVPVAVAHAGLRTIPEPPLSQPSPPTPSAEALALAVDAGRPAEAQTNSLGMRLVSIPTGEFQMGSSESDVDAFKDEMPRRRVRIAGPFVLGATEVTVGQFRRFIVATGSSTEAERDGEGGWGWDEPTGTSVKDPRYTWRFPGFAQTDEHPVVNVSRNDAEAFCRWLSQQEGRAYRLPTEEEWEYACRAGTTTRYWSGDDAETLAAVANVADATAKAMFPAWTTITARDGYLYTAPVGRFRANAWGLHDMHGNVWEWCAGGDEGRANDPSTGDDPADPSGVPVPVVRGGSWYGRPRVVRSASRSGFAAGYRSSVLGFRVARDPL